MFSATWPQSIQKLAHEFLKVIIKIKVLSKKKKKKKKKKIF